MHIQNGSRGNSNKYQHHMLLESGREKHTDCNLKTKKLVDCALIRVCALGISNTLIVVSANRSKAVEILFSLYIGYFYCGGFVM